MGRVEVESVVWQTPETCTFTGGRLGYACLNTVLRECTPSIFCSRSIRLDTVRREGIQAAKNLGLQNARDILPMLEWNEAHHIRFVRLSSEMFPFASHDEFGYSLEYAAGPLRAAGEYARAHGHRLTAHPGQFTQLGSPRPAVIEHSLQELHYHAQMLDLMGMPADSVMIIHGGGAYGDKAAALQRFETNFARLNESARRRLVLENDEVVWTVADLLPLCQRLQIPLVLDWHHDRLNPSPGGVNKYLSDIEAVWRARGIRPKQHHSESRTDGSHPRAHSDRVRFMPPCAPDTDLMIEAKDKEQAVLELYRRFRLAPVLSDEESAAVTARIVAAHMARCAGQDEHLREAGLPVPARATASSQGRGRVQLKGDSAARWPASAAAAAKSVQYKRRFAQEAVASDSDSDSDSGSSSDSSADSCCAGVRADEQSDVEADAKVAPRPGRRARVAAPAAAGPAPVQSAEPLAPAGGGRVGRRRAAVTKPEPVLDALSAPRRSARVRTQA